jgi:ribosomal protein S18 acetylase RimI-like enzyme
LGFAKGESVDPTSTIRSAGAPDIERLIDILATAFESDPFMTWLLPAAETRLRGVRRLFTQLVLTRMNVDGECYVTEHGGAVWARPGGWRISARRQLRTLHVLARTVGRHLPRALSAVATLDHHHPDEPVHWYLEALGVSPGHQRRGIGSRLLEPVLNSCDTDRVPAYLETATERNLAFYHRIGFQVCDEFDLGKGPHIWTMWREPHRR